jgi:hypothetical protein
MVNPGNHEDSFRFAHYTEFFRDQPYNLIDQTVTTDNGDAPNNWCETAAILLLPRLLSYSSPLLSLHISI